MRFLIISTLVCTFISISSPRVHAYSDNIISSDGKDSHSVLPGDLAQAYCLANPEVGESRVGIYNKLKALGHDISDVVRDSRFSQSHIQDIYKAVLLMPSWLGVGSQVADGVKYKVDDSRNAVAWMYKGTLTINPLRWNNIVKDMRTSIIFHELSHLLGLRIYNVDDSLTWQNIDGAWRSDSLRRDGSIYEGKPLNPASLVSNYAMTNPAEDFAESVSSYRIKPSVLKRTSPKRYEFIKNSIFLGKEFVDETNCNLQVEDVIDVEGSKQFFVTKLRESNKHVDLAYKYASRRRLRDPKALELKFRKAVMRSVLNSEGYGRQTSPEQYKQKNELRIYMRRLLQISDFEDFETQYSRDMVRKLIR
jgi:hypothetical protein